MGPRLERGDGRSGVRRGVQQPLQGERPLPRVEVADGQLGGAARCAAPIADDGHGRPLPDHVPPDPDPAAPLELQAQAAAFPQRTVERVRQAHGLEGQEPRSDPPGMGRQASQEDGVPDGQASGEVQDQEIHGPSGEERAGQPEAFVGASGPDEHEPAQVHASSDRFQRVERAREVQPGDDRAGGLGLSHAAKGECRLARGAPAPERGARPAGQAAQGQDRIQAREAGRDDLRGERSLGSAGGRRPGSEWQPGRGESQSPDRARGTARSTGAVTQPDGGASPTRLQADEGRGERLRPRQGGPGWGGEAGPGGPHGPTHDRTDVLLCQGSRGQSARPVTVPSPGRPTLAAYHGPPHAQHHRPRP